MREQFESYQSVDGVALDDAIHHLAQPLTAMLFVLEMARLQQKPEVWRTAIDTATDECRRAIDVLQEVRAAAAPRIGKGRAA